MKHDRFQVDGDASIRLTDFEIKPPSAFLGLIGTNDEVLVRLLLWAIKAAPRFTPDLKPPIQP